MDIEEVTKSYAHFSRVYITEDEAYPVLVIEPAMKNDDFNVTVPTRLIAELNAANALVKVTEDKIKLYLTQSGQKAGLA